MSTLHTSTATVPAPGLHDDPRIKTIFNLLSDLLDSRSSAAAPQAASGSHSDTDYYRSDCHHRVQPSYSDAVSNTVSNVNLYSVPLRTPPAPGDPPTGRYSLTNNNHHAGVSHRIPLLPTPVYGIPPTSRSAGDPSAMGITSIGPVAPNIPQTPGFPRPLFRPSLLRRKLITRGQLGQLPTRQGLNTILLGLFPLPTGFHWTLSHAAPGLPLPPFRLSLLRRKLTMLGRLVTRALPITLLIHRVLTWRGSPNPTALTTPVQPLGPTPTHNFHTAPHKVNHTPPNSLHVAPIRTSPKWLKL